MGARSSARLRSLRVFVDHSAESVTSDDLANAGFGPAFTALLTRYHVPPAPGWAETSPTETGRHDQRRPGGRRQSAITSSEKSEYQPCCSTDDTHVDPCKSNKLNPPAPKGL